MLIRHPSRLHTADDGAEPQAGAAPEASAASATPQAGTTDAAPAAADAPTLTPAEARALKNEAQNLRRRLKEFEEAKAEAERAALSETERLKADHAAATERLSATERELRAYRLRDAIEAAVGPATLPQEGGEAKPNDLHGISPKLAVRLIDVSALEVDEAGAIKPSALRRALAALATEYPEIRGQAPTRPALTPQRAAAGGSLRHKSTAQRQIDQRYTTLPANVTKR